MTHTYGSRPTFDMGRVVEQTFGALAAHGPILLVISLVVVGLPQALAGYGEFLFAGLSTEGGDWFMAAGISVLSFVLSIVGHILIQGVTAWTVVQDLQGRKATFGEAVAATVESFWVLVAVGIVVGLATGLGLILLLVPGIIIALMWSVVGPVAVTERAGVSRSLSRSRDLTRNHRWMILGLMVVYVVGTTALSAVLVALAAAITGWQAAGESGVWISVGVVPILQAVFAVLGAAGVAAIYVELRRVKEGGGRESVAAIFD